MISFIKPKNMIKIRKMQRNYNSSIGLGKTLLVAGLVGAVALLGGCGAAFQEGTPEYEASQRHSEFLHKKAQDKRDAQEVYYQRLHEQAKARRARGEKDPLTDFADRVYGDAVPRALGRIAAHEYIKKRN